MRTLIERDDVITAIKNYDLSDYDILSFIEEYTDRLSEKEEVIEFKNEIAKIFIERLNQIDWLDDIREANRHNRI
jgi:hypothetical protein